MRQPKETEGLRNVVEATQNRVGEPVGTEYSMERLQRELNRCTCWDDTPIWIKHPPCPIHDEGGK